MPPILNIPSVFMAERRPVCKPVSNANEILIKGKYYDVTEFKERHPGGHIICYYLGQDATEAFNAFHARSSKVEKYLATIPCRSATGTGSVPGGFHAANSTVIKSYQETDPLVADFEKLRQDLYREGFFEPCLWHVAYRLFEIIFMHAIGINLVWNGWTTAGILILGIAQGRCGWVMHEGGHYSLTGNTSVDLRIQEVTQGIGCGLSAGYWRNQHNKHHAMPQKLKHDVDLRTLPLVAFHAEIAKRGYKAWLRWQAFLFLPIVTVLVGIVWQFFLHPRYSLRTRNTVELSCYVLRYLAISTYFLGEYSLVQQVCLYTAFSWIYAVYCFTNFALSHTHTPVVGATEQLDWVRFAANHTVNIQPSFWCDWWMGFLNYQIEHHLFPTMPQFRTPVIAPRVRALLEKHGVVYDVRSYWGAVTATFSNLHSVGKTGL